MSLPTVASLSSALGRDLYSATEQPLPDTPITAVHISELLDPSPYLSGGELLLTLGIALPSNRMGCRRYVNALRGSRVSAVAIGLGPVYQEVPERLANACADGDLPLLVVPIRTPFLKVTKAYWRAVARSTERHLSDAITTHRVLVDAAASPDPVPEVLKRLSRWLGGWAAVLDTSGRVEHLRPAGAYELAEQLQDDVRRLEVAGVNSSASFVAAGRTVVLLPLAVAGQIAGYLAVGTEQQLDASQRAVVMGACGLLSLDASRTASAASAQAARRSDVLDLVVDGFVDAADRLAAHAGLGPLPRECRVLSVYARDTAPLAAAVRGWAPEAIGSEVDRRASWYIIPAGHGDLAELESVLRAVDDTVRAAVSALVHLGEVGAVHARLADVVRMSARGTVALAATSACDDDLARRLEAVESAGRPVVQALAAYLRSHGQWEPASRDLGVHRNTLRYRVDRARELLGVDLGDIEVTSRLWLIMGRRGLT